MRRYVTKAYWAELWAGLRMRVAMKLFSAEFDKETARRHAEWEAAARPQVRLEPSPGVEILAMSVWSEGKTKCREHCWHPVGIVPRHHDPDFIRGRHVDYVCCRCTNTLCMTCSELAASAVRPPTPAQHVKVKR